MNELEKLAAKATVAEYAEENGMIVLRDYGSWMAIGFPQDVQPKQVQSLGKLGKRRRDHAVPEDDAKRMIENNIKSAIDSKETVYATTPTSTR